MCAINTDAAASAATTLMAVLCAELCGICSSLGVSGVSDTLVPQAAFEPHAGQSRRVTKRVPLQMQ